MVTLMTKKPTRYTDPRCWNAHRVDRARNYVEIIINYRSDTKESKQFERYTRAYWLF